ncbi:hypothetical protein RO3G_07199 [Rhizopus delemar RA 99-880]|uniref:Uncharacterized protein n=1 Tax=Rhizopus delemar (strain RA 99-880 / ATCC MYA-4621 / FGSC 9543 / NRRL 43880) TaxID=246409 RepID=I1C214_RHIO9|nr:hypothetical protein RO3G_07199 [Rhizopus delemar RA 99-880]|eukprot:EIE82494.1 hypothetical protein RO3G_07199 [Rhizopus delemar RA 99-880]
MTEFLKLILIVLSLLRLALSRHRKLDMIQDVKQRDEVEMLCFNEEDDVINLRFDIQKEKEMDTQLEEDLIRTIDDTK